MIDPIDRGSGRAPIPPQLAMRVAVVGVIGFALFAIIFFRLWYLQVLSGDSYLRQAQVNKVRTERIAAPRGTIRDRNGNELVINEKATVITLDPRNIPTVEKELAAAWGKEFASRQRAYTRAREARLRTIAELRADGKRREARRVPRVKKPEKVPIPSIPSSLRERFRELGGVIGMRSRTIQERVILGLWLAPYAPVKIKTGVPDDVRDYLYERPERFPGVLPQQTYLRKYPHENVAAQIFGTVGQIDQEQLDAGSFPGATSGEIVGQSGLERRYDADLRGRDGLQRFFVDAQGNPQGAGAERPPVAGRSLTLTLDKELQEVGQQAMLQSGRGRPAAFVAMNPENGAVYAIGSYPSFDPNELSRPITERRYNQLFSAEAGSPLFNRAITGAYPTGSTFKPFTALAALSRGEITTSTVIASPPCVKISTNEFCNAGKADLGSGNVSQALKISADVFFYKLGAQINPQTDIQQWARKLGLGRTTGIDLPGEAAGTIPDKKWRAQRGEAERECRRDKGIPQNVNVFESGARGCGLSDQRPWSIGDNVQVAIGQGDVQATPLQMAVGYSALANGGRVVRPHLGAEVDDAEGRLIRRIRSSRGKKVTIDRGHRDAVSAGLLASTAEEGGTSFQVFKGAGWDEERFPVYGKTGTAQRPPKQDQSWFVCWSVDRTGKRPPIVIAATVEDAGFGADFAAPAARLMLAQWFGQDKAAKLVESRSTTR